MECWSIGVVCHVSGGVLDYLSLLSNRDECLIRFSRIFLDSRFISILLLLISRLVSRQVWAKHLKFKDRSVWLPGTCRRKSQFPERLKFACRFISPSHPGRQKHQRISNLHEKPLVTSAGGITAIQHVGKPGWILWRSAWGVELLAACNGVLLYHKTLLFVDFNIMIVMISRDTCCTLWWIESDWETCWFVNDHVSGSY